MVCSPYEDCGLEAEGFRGVAAADVLDSDVRQVDVLKAGVRGVTVERSVEADGTLGMHFWNDVTGMAHFKPRPF